ncbi:MAG: fimbrillin family protein [Bacteroidales bacterium]|nr:fimbrillin family protein [Bacteroidales bacterium]
MKKEILSHILTFITLCLSSAGIFFGCKSDDDVAPKSRVAANFFGNVISATRLDGTAWEVGDEIGLFQWQQDGRLADPLTSNTRYAVNTDGTCSVGDGDSAIFLLRDSLYTITGYYPFTVNEIEDDSIYQISDWNRQNELNYDLLFAQATGISADAPDVTLSFAHRFCQLMLNIVVDASSSITADSLAGLAVTLSGKNVPVSLNLHSGVLTYNYATVGGNIDVPVEIDEDTPTQATASAIVAPDEANTVSDRVLTFTFASGRVHTYTIPADLLFEAGKAYEMNFTFTGDHIIYVSADGVEGADGRALATALPTVTAAVERIIQFQNPVDWTICVSGEVVAANEISNSLTSEHATSLTITGLHENSGDNYTDILDGGSTYAETAGEATINGSVISISTDVPITISNLKITNGISTGGYGGGIQMGAAVGELTLESGAWITENHTYYSAGGIMISGSDAQCATVIMKDGSRVTNNSSRDWGGGFWNGGILILEGGEISGNTSGVGGAICHSGTEMRVSGSISIPVGDDADNPQDVYLMTENPFTAYSITVAGELTGTSPVMTIQGSSGYISAYAGYQIIKAGDGVTLTSDIIGKFALTETDSYYISADGYLQAY